MKAHISRERLELIDFSLLEKDFKSWMEIKNLTRRFFIIRHTSMKSLIQIIMYLLVYTHVFVGIYTCIS